MEIFTEEPLAIISFSADLICQRMILALLNPDLKPSLTMIFLLLQKL